MTPKPIWRARRGRGRGRSARHRGCRRRAGPRPIVQLAAAACLLLPHDVSGPGVQAGPAAAREPEAVVVTRSLAAFAEAAHGYGFDGVVLVVRGGDTLLHRGYGLADRGAGEPHGPDTRFRVASITKILTAAAILTLEDEGRLHTMDSVVRYVGDLGGDKNGVRIHHLATHTGGLAVRGTEVDAATIAGFVDRMRTAPREAGPGTEYRYTNAGLSLMAAVAERASGTPFEAYVREAVLEPLELGHTAFQSDGLEGGDATGYVLRGRDLRPAAEAPPPWGSIGATGWVARVRDLATLRRGLRDGSILSETARRKMFFPWDIEGYGWHVEEHGRYGVRAVHKGGDTEGFRSQILWFPNDAVEVYWASNNRSFRGWAYLNRGLASIAMGREFPGPPRPASARSTPAGLIGTWVAEDGSEITFHEAAGGAMAEGSGATDIEGVPFFAAGGDGAAAILPAGEIAVVDIGPSGSDLALVIAGETVWSGRRGR